ncbi:YhfC family glutamic-type intramembrane protease [Acetanaerobacterium sp. MSJ-12]|uniref:YhfC family glutamic-type intramembrane protease n=1 Tax=Acetanaerobacterium sp. MSJ-12 TaxID=2841535 RepID=UPI00336BE24E
MRPRTAKGGSDRGGAGNDIHLGGVGGAAPGGAFLPAGATAGPPSSLLGRGGDLSLFQLLLRIPLLGWLREWDGLALLAFRSPWLYALFLALTAALFEEGGRYLAARLLLKGRTGCGEAMAFGLGHWGLEALSLVGLPLLLSLLAAPGLTLAAGAGGLLAAGVERVAALPVHLAATRLVFAGVRRHRALPLLAAFALHTLVDLLAALGSLAGLPLWGIEGGLLAVAALLAAWMIGDRRRERKGKRGCR